MLNLPKHIAIIMDGNHRWAIKHNTDLNTAYKKGAQAANKVVNYCLKHSIRYVTLYAFSLENWTRPANEVQLIMHIFHEAMINQLKNVTKKNIKVLFIGNRCRMQNSIIDTMNTLETISQNNSQLILTIAVSYGSRDQILDAAKVAYEIHTNQNISYNIAFEKAINPNNIPDPDLLIRTSGEMRLSNFLLWQLAYAELYFTDILWPNFNTSSLKQAIQSYQQRKRRFGKRTEEKH